MDDAQFDRLLDRLEPVLDRVIEPVLDPSEHVTIPDLRRRLDAADIADKVLLSALRDLGWDVGRVNVTDPATGKRGKAQAVKGARWQPEK